MVVHSKLRNVALKVLNALKDKLFSEYGETVKKYFKDEKRGYLESYSANAAFEEESWFNFEEESVDDIIGGQAKSLLADGFKDFINNDKTIGGKRSRPNDDASIPTVFFSGESDMDTVSEATTIKNIRKALKKRGVKRKVWYNIVNANDSRTNPTLKA